MAVLAVMDLKSRYVLLEEVDDISAEETAIKLLKVGSIFNFKDCILRTDPGTNFAASDVQELLLVMRAKWKVGVAGNHVEQAHIERAFRELNYHIRPILSGLTSKPIDSRLKLRMGVYLAARIYNNSINHLGFAPAQMFIPSETLDLQIVYDSPDTEKRSDLVRYVMELQQEILSQMLVAQEAEYDKRLNDWTNEGKEAWDELLRLDIDDYVLINYPKNQKLNFSNIGPYRVTQMIDKEYFVEVQSLVDVSVKFKVKANKLIRFNYDPRCKLTPADIQAEDKREALVLEVVRHTFPGGNEKFSDSKGQRAQLQFLVRFQTGERWLPWKEVRYLEAFDVYLGTNAFSRKLTSKLRTKDRKARVTGPIFLLVWKESFDNAYMAKPDGIALDDDVDASIESIPIGVTPDQKKRVRDLLFRFADLFKPRRKGQFMNYPLVKYQEKLDPNGKYFGRKWEQPRKIHDPRALAACVDILDELEVAGLIEKIPVEDDLLEWNIPINMVIDKYEKVEGFKVPKYRLCLDSRGANSRMEAEPFPRMSAEDVFQNLAGKPHQSIMDLPKAFFSIEVDKDSKKFSAFTHPVSGQRYWFNGMIMGNVNSASHFQTFMQRVFQEDKPYIDDLAIGDKSFEDHFQHLERTFQLCWDNNISLSPKKCKFNMPSLKVLGRVTDKEWRKVDDETITRIKLFAKPTTVKQMMAFCGLVNWMRDYLPGIGEKMAPFYEMTKSVGPEAREELDTKKKYRHLLRQRLQWTPELEATFAEVKQYCSCPERLFYIDPSLPIYVNTDASLKGWGGIIYQLDVDGTKKICGVKSGSWNSVQAKWPTVEQEAYAIYRTVIDFECYLIGRPFTLFTDSQNLTFLTESPSRKVQRWRLALQMFSFHIHHIAGEINIEADSLSRISFVDDNE